MFGDCGGGNSGGREWVMVVVVVRLGFGGDGGGMVWLWVGDDGGGVLMVRVEGGVVRVTPSGCTMATRATWWGAWWAAQSWRPAGVRVGTTPLATRRAAAGFGFA